MANEKNRHAQFAAPGRMETNDIGFVMINAIYGAPMAVRISSESE